MSDAVKVLRQRGVNTKRGFGVRLVILPVMLYYRLSIENSCAELDKVAVGRASLVSVQIFSRENL